MNTHKLKFVLLPVASVFITIIISIFVLNHYYNYFDYLNIVSFSQDKKFVEEQTNVDVLPYSERDWLIYTDKELGYRIAYPSGLRVIPTSEDGSIASISKSILKESGGVSFASLGPGVMGVKVYTNTPFDTTTDWLIFENKKRENVRRDLEKIISIDGNEALVTYTVIVIDQYEEAFINEKRTIFMKNGSLFEIWTRFFDDEDNHKKAWDSFKFINESN